MHYCNYFWDFYIIILFSLIEPQAYKKNCAKQLSLSYTTKTLSTGYFQNTVQNNVKYANLCPYFL